MFSQYAAHSILYMRLMDSSIDFKKAITIGDHIWKAETPSKNRWERKTRKFAEPDFSPRMLQALGAMLDIVVYCYPNGQARWA